MGLRKVYWLVIFACSLLVLEVVLAEISEVEGEPESCSENPVATTEKPLVKPILSTPLECARKCRKGDPPKICYYQFTLEMYTVLGGACQLCTPNNTNQLNATCQCVTANGVERTLLTTNRMLPGPSIQVCINDTIAVDVKNEMPGMACSIHWHGVFQPGTQYYDGVPHITQCPILQGNTFRYEFLAGNSGTHFWHAHTGLQKLNGIHGSVIIREPLSDDPNCDLYDEDLCEHAIVLADWMHEMSEEHFPGRLTSNTGQRPASILINGRGRYTDPATNVSTTTPYEVLKVEKGKRYRLRIINSFCTSCCAEFTIEKHNMTLIATDGIPVKSTNITSFISCAGERYDVVIHACESIGSYWIRVRGTGECADTGVYQLAIIQYEGEPEFTQSVPPTYAQNLTQGRVLNPEDGLCNITRDDAICINQLKSAVPVDEELIKDDECEKIYFALGFSVYTLEDLFGSNTYEAFEDPGGIRLAGMVNNISFAYPTSPPLSQYDDISADQWCSPNETRPDCGGVCHCTQKVDLKLDNCYEVIMCDGLGIPGLSHPIHMHGYAFNVIGMGISTNPNVTKMSVKHAIDLDSKNQLCRNKDRPPYKDTVTIPSGGYVIAKFKADNPGWWLVHCHFLYHTVIGMDMLLHVGEPKDLPRVPRHFPKCGDYLHPIGNKKYNRKSPYN